MNHHYLIFFFIGFLMLSSCSESVPDTMFTEIPKNKTGIDFRNLIRENENFNIFQYQYFYNGGGLATGDFNNDGLQDLVFTGNMVKNRLFINKGGLKFEDITVKSGIAEKEGWCTGVTTIDINQDGFLDIYICRAGYPFEKLRRNLLFINNGDLTFTEKAADYGIDDPANSTHAAFFDYDKDNDLDLFILNHSTLEYSTGNLEIFALRKKKNPEFTNKLFRNDGQGQFVNVTDEAGIFSNVLSFSLGLSITDIDQDGWQDIFVGNDFNEPDYLFINQKDGTFKDQLSSYFDHTSMFSMGSDVADFNNDGHLDMVSLDMLPEGNYLQKMHSGADNFDKVSLMVKNGFFNQYSRNMLQLNNGNNTFSEIGQLSGVSNTDWSWAPLFFDFDNDGNKDLFIANGYLRDHTDMDFLNYTANEVLKINQGEEAVNFGEYMAAMPPILQPNYFYHNQGNLHFENKTSEWGLEDPVVSQSAVYVDLDNDGDLDLALNNSDAYAGIYRNNSDKITENNYLKISFKGAKGNPQGVGAKVKFHAGGKVFFQEQQPVRGFQSTVDVNLIFGLGSIDKIDKLTITWPTDEKQELIDIEVNQVLTLNIEEAKKANPTPVAIPKSLFTESNLFEISHSENDFVDFKTQGLLPWFYSREGPGMAVSDVNGDGLDDIYVGNAKGKTGKFLIQVSDGNFVSTSSIIFEQDAQSEDVDAVFFDANGDQAPDLVVASGGYEFGPNSKELKDRLYLNDGKGNFQKSENSLPDLLMNSSCVASADVDKDGDLDLFIGGGVKHNGFPTSHENQLLLNDGKGNFLVAENSGLTTPGITKDASWLDLNNDGYPELIIAGEWMPVTVFGNDKGKFSNKTSKYIPGSPSGLWHSIHAADFDGDGDYDLVAGNLGTNSQLSASENEPLELYFADFDQNQSIDPLLFYYVQGTSHPIASRDDLINQLAYLKKQFLYFSEYANATVNDILTENQIQNAGKLKATSLETVYFENMGNEFSLKTLPIEAQVAPVHAITSIDANGDGNLDIIMAGNSTHARVKLGRLDGNHGLVLIGDGNGNFKAPTPAQSGIKARSAVRSIEKLKSGSGTHLVFGINNGKTLTYANQ